ncbi:MAG: hypothetical protein B7Y78_05910 [Caulobacter sp. 35-67-4]|nr:MAG: hypothetical protein B7Y78_05910 [Caulobacter sp. 35-67-4]
MESLDIAPRIWLIAGPTASGKSAYALRLAQEIGGEIVNADSMQIYAGLRVLTAGPSPEDMAAVPHHLFGTVDAAQTWSVGKWLEAAMVALRDIDHRGKPAVVVGGTGLYFRALTHGLADVPALPPKAQDMIAILVKGHEAVAKTARAVFTVADAVNDQPTADLMTQRLDIHEKTAWMLRSLLEG